MRSRPSIVRRALWAAHTARHAPGQGRFPFLPPERIEAAQRRRLRATIAHARDHVPHYRETMRRLGLEVKDLSRAEDLRRLPIVERQDLQTDPERFVSRTRPLSSCVPLTSGGSSGRPVTIHYDRFSFVQAAAHRERFRSILLRLAGQRLRIREAQVVPAHSNVNRVVDAYGGLGALPRGLRVDLHRLPLADDVESTVAALGEIGPDVVASFGSALADLFARIDSAGPHGALPRVARFGGDAVLPGARRMIEDMGVEVLGAYQAIEAHNLAFECPEHRGYHVNVDLCAVRIVDPEGRDLPRGESGEVVISNLINRGTVLLNYRLGDEARLLPDPCPCGRSLPLLELHSRSDERLRVPGRSLSGLRLRHAFVAEPEVLQFQIAQLAPDRVRVRVIARPEARWEALHERLDARFGELLGEDCGVEVVLVDSLPRTATGKVSAVVPLKAADPVARSERRQPPA